MPSIKKCKQSYPEAVSDYLKMKRKKDPSFKLADARAYVSDIWESCKADKTSAKKSAKKSTKTPAKKSAKKSTKTSAKKSAKTSTKTSAKKSTKSRKSATAKKNASDIPKWCEQTYQSSVSSYLKMKREKDPLFKLEDARAYVSEIWEENRSKRESLCK